MAWRLRWHVREWGHWHLRVPLCCAGLLACSEHRLRGEIDASWLRPDWRGRLTRGWYD